MTSANAVRNYRDIGSPATSEGAGYDRNFAAERVIGIRPKLFSFGNSINKRNQLGESQANYFSAWGFLTWIHALSGAAFDRCRSNSYNWGAQGNPGGNETIDQFGCYGWGGAQINYSAAYSMLNHLPNVISSVIDTPDIVYVSSIFENDIGANAAPNVNQIILSAKRMLQLFRNAWPNALIVLSCPGPSTGYTTPAQHQAFQQITAWVQSLSSSPHVLVEDNLAMIQPGTLDQPIASYTSDNIIHQNERGAYVRAKAWLAKLGYLFPERKAIPQSPYNSTTPDGVFQVNPDFSLLGAPGGSVNGVVYTSYDWYADSGIVPTVTANAQGSGINISISASSTTSPGSGVSFASDAGQPTVPNSATLQSLVDITINNPANLAEITHRVNYSGGTANPCGIWWQSSFLTSYPQGMSDVWQSGDTFTLSSPPLPPGSTNTNAFTQTGLIAVAGMTASTPANQLPNVTVKSQNLVQTINNSPQGLSIATGSSYTNQTPIPQQIVITGTATWTSLTLTRSGTAVALPTANGVITLAPGDSLSVVYSAGTPVFTII